MFVFCFVVCVCLFWIYCDFGQYGGEVGDVVIWIYGGFCVVLQLFDWDQFFCDIVCDYFWDVVCGGVDDCSFIGYCFEVYDFEWFVD